MASEKSISICNIFRDNTSKIINKLEMQIPANIQIYSDLYKEYLHLIEDVYGTCILSEKEFLDKMNIDENFMRNVQEFSNNYTDMCINQIDYFGKYLKWYSEMRISGMKSYDQVMHSMMESYSNILSNCSRNFGK